MTQDLFSDAVRRALSDDRLEPYQYRRDRESCDLTAPIMRYCWNVALCASLYPALHILEVTLRNALYDAIALRHPPNSRAYGMSQAEVDQVTQALEQFEAVTIKHHDAKSAHVSARADLKATARELMEVIHQLDSINTYRFQEDAKALAGWKSARDVAWPMKEEKPLPEEGQAQPAA